MRILHCISSVICITAIAYLGFLTLRLNETCTKHIGVIAYHFYDGGRTAIGLKGRITTIVDPPSAYGFEVDGHAVQTNKTTWYTSVDGQKIGYVEIKSSKSIEYSTSSVK